MPPRARLVLKPPSSPEPIADEPAPPSVVATAVEAPKAARADRQAKRIIAGHFPKSTWVQLRTLCTKHDKTSQALLEEALTDLFAKYRT
jgi:hypothetical protein